MGIALARCPRRGIHFVPVSINHELFIYLFICIFGVGLIKILGIWMLPPADKVPNCLCISRSKVLLASPWLECSIPVWVCFCLIVFYFFSTQDAEVANMYKMNRETYNQTAKFWTETYAQVKFSSRGVCLPVSCGRTDMIIIQKAVFPTFSRANKARSRCRILESYINGRSKRWHFFLFLFYIYILQRDIIKKK